MKKQSRRGFLQLTGLLSASFMGMGTKRAHAGPRNILSYDRQGVLVDTTVCIGCRNCEWACREAHGMATDRLETYEDRSVFESKRRPDPTALTVVNEYPGKPPKRTPIDVKFQCMHCDHPACVSACIVGAFSKVESGAVVWDTDKCIGCRYCMVACPFQVPAFQYDQALQPNVMKCDFCIERTQKGKRPACVDICPVEAMTYGPRTELIQIARERIRKYPERYADRVYGETEVGGTSWLYLAGRDFAEIGFPRLGANPAPGVTESIQHGIFAYFVPPISLYALLGGIMWMMKSKQENE
jgi:Fe-S-cluster-containing dehydrogenase component